MNTFARSVAIAALGLALAPAILAQPPAGPSPGAASAPEAPEGDAPRAPTPEEEAEIAKAQAEFEAKLDHHTGRVALPAAHVTLNVPDGYYFLDAEDSRAVLEEAWGNPPDTSVSGMLFPASGGPFVEHSWGAVLTFEDTGYVSDEDASGINYDELIQTMRDQTREDNAQRREAGFPSLEIIGWAAEPRYDAKLHKLYWAKEIAFEGEPVHTLNYDMRVLGRQGVLSLNFVAGVDELAMIEKASPRVLAIPDFDPGFRYQDFNAATDRKSDLSVVGLIAGGTAAAVLAKNAGILGVLLPLLAKFWYAIVAIFLAAGAAIRNMFGGKSKPVAPRSSGVDTSFLDGPPQADAPPEDRPSSDKPPSV